MPALLCMRSENTIDYRVFRECFLFSKINQELEAHKPLS
ncbi:predicted protein [Botrytis cinerea T4]|uniref:Uncharacterized protein n=1 Tax=Botryotinia fuckeliana (strain T4) TaxID=999810 RepID=G2Y3G1_BOTF4|nr:predicted protein [Botrytis cinerea T4]